MKTERAVSLPQRGRESKTADTLPFKVVADELVALRKTFRELVQTYSTQVEAEITALHVAVTAQGSLRKRLPAGRAHELRDMLMLVRSLEVKPAKGRRRDLKKIEGLIEELRRLIERWA